MTHEKFDDTGRPIDNPADEYSEFTGPYEPNSDRIAPPGSGAARQGHEVPGGEGGPASASDLGIATDPEEPALSGTEPATRAGRRAATSGGAASQAAAKAAEVKDVAVERGSDVAEVAKDEVARVASEARDHIQGLWSQAGSQITDQLNEGRRQLAELLHSLSSEMGHLASRSEQDGPVTAFARQASNRGGQWAHYLSITEPQDMMRELGRFARRRPFVFLAGAATAGVVVGRLSRGLMAGSSNGQRQLPRAASVANREYATGIGAYETVTPSVATEGRTRSASAGLGTAPGLRDTREGLATTQGVNEDPLTGGSV